MRLAHLHHHVFRPALLLVAAGAHFGRAQVESSGEPPATPVRAAPTRPATMTATETRAAAPAAVNAEPAVPLVAALPLNETAPSIADVTAAPAPPETPAPEPGPPVTSWLEAQIELARRGFSCGSIDGAVGPKTRAALTAFQTQAGLTPTGELDADTRAQLTLRAPAYTEVVVMADDLAALQPLSPTWLGKSQQSALAYETALEALAERYHAHPALLRQLNPTLDWTSLAADAAVRVPAVARARIAGSAERIRISLAACTLEVFDAADRMLAHFPVSIGRTAEKRPSGELRVITVAADPNFTFDPAVFPESPEARELLAQGRKLILPPGPNNPVGVAWIGLDRPGYGIHGTPSPERVGRAESHGCFRLTNWDARTLLTLVRIGLLVQIEP